MKKALYSILIIGGFISTPCCTPETEEFELYRSHVVGQYTVDYLGITVDTTFFRHNNYKFDIIEPSPRNYEIKFNPIHTPDSIYTLANIGFVLTSYSDHVWPSAYVLIDQGQHFQNSEYRSDYIYAGPYLGHSGKYMNLALNITGTNQSFNSIRKLSFWFAYKPL